MGMTIDWKKEYRLPETQPVTDLEKEYRRLLIRHVELIEEYERAKLLLDKLLTHRVTQFLLEKDALQRNRRLS